MAKIGILLLNSFDKIIKLILPDTSAYRSDFERNKVK